MIFFHYINYITRATDVFVIKAKRVRSLDVNWDIPENRCTLSKEDMEIFLFFKSTFSIWNSQGQITFWVAKVKRR